MLADLDSGVDAIQVGHDDVADEHVGLKGPCDFYRFFAAVNGGGFKSALIEDDGKGIGNDAFVIGYQHFGFA